MWIISLFRSNLHKQKFESDITSAIAGQDESLHQTYPRPHRKLGAKYDPESSAQCLTPKSICLFSWPSFNLTCSGLPPPPSIPPFWCSRNFLFESCWSDLRSKLIQNISNLGSFLLLSAVVKGHFFYNNLVWENSLGFPFYLKYNVSLKLYVRLEAGNISNLGSREVIFPLYCFHHCVFCPISLEWSFSVLWEKETICSCWR